MRTVLFLCSGNSCRSLYAERLFNHLAEQSSIPWRAASRGLMVDWMEAEIPVSAEVAIALQNYSIDIDTPFQSPIQVDESDFEIADLLIAVNESEHRPVFQARYPDWEDDVEFWVAPDLVLSNPEATMTRLSKMVELLVDDLTDVPVRVY